MTGSLTRPILRKYQSPFSPIRAWPLLDLFVLDAMREHFDSAGEFEYASTDVEDRADRAVAMHANDRNRIHLLNAFGDLVQGRAATRVFEIVAAFEMDDFQITHEDIFVATKRAF